MEEAFRAGGFLDKPPAKSPHCASSATKDAALPPPKREDVDLIVSALATSHLSETNNLTLSLLQVHEFEITRVEAERVLFENGGDLTKALTSLVTPPSNTVRT